MKLLNLGCGHRFHRDWVNIDFYPIAPDVIVHNLLEKLPFADHSFEAVYHSHVLEHFSKEDGKSFIKECHRVLKPNGIIRVVVPDLEQIVKLYLQKLEQAWNGDQQTANDYEWMMLEMYDQTVRNQQGGEMNKYLTQDEIPNESFVYERIGEEGRQIRLQFLLNQEKLTDSEANKAFRNNNLSYLKKSLRSFFDFFSTQSSREKRKYQKIGKFRLSGEVHQWMYDRYSLKKLLSETGFKHFTIKTAFDSQIPDWNRYELEGKDGLIFKPDSIFVEAIK